MSNVLGSIIVDLLARTVSFEAGMNASARLANKTGKDIERAFQDIGSTADKILSGLGPVAGEFGAALEGIGVSARALLSELGPLAGVLGPAGPIAVGLAGIAAVAGGVSIAALGLASHTAEAAAKLGELSVRTGIGTEALAGFQFAGKKVGVETEAITKALEFMNSNMVKAAIAPEGTKNAFTRLGVAVKDASGAMRDPAQVFLEVMGKIAALPQPEQGYFVKQLFGRGGAAILPLLNEGIDSLKKNIADAKEFGLGDPDTIAAAQKYKETVVEIQAEFEGLTLKLTKELLPALEYLASAVSEAFKTGAAQEMIDKLANLTKEVLGLGYEIAHLPKVNIFGDAAAGIAELQGAGNQLAIKAHQAMVHAGMVGRPDIVQEEDKLAAKALEDNWRETAKRVNDNIHGIGWDQYLKDVENFKKGLEKAPAGPFDWAKPLLDSFKPRISDVDLSPGGGKKPDDFVAKKVQDAERLAQKEEQLATAMGQTTSAAIEARAVAESSEKIQQLWDEAVNKGVVNTKSFEKAWRDAVPAIQSAAEWEQTFKAVIEDQKAFDEFDKKINQHIASLQGQVEATGRVGEEQAKQRASLEPLAEDLAKANKQYGVMLASFGDLDPRTKELARDVAGLSAEYATAAAKVETVNTLIQGDAFKNELDRLNLQLTALTENNAALLTGGEAYAQIDAEVRKLTHDLGLNEAQQAQVGQTLEEIRRKQLEGGIDTLVSNANPETSQHYKDLNYQIEALEKMRDQWHSMGKDTQPVQTALLQLNADLAQVMATMALAQDRAVHMWDEAKIAAGTFGEKADAVMNELIIQGHRAGEEITKAFQTAIDGIETQFAKLLTGQKVNFKQIFQGLAEQVTKAEIQKGVGELAGKFHIPGLEGRPDGSAGKAFHVIVDSGIPGIQNLSDSAGLGGVFGRGGFEGFLSKMFSGGGLPFTAGDLAAPTAIPGVVGAIGKSFSLPTDLFPGLAEGGDVTPGRAYLVGERGPEIRTFGSPGQITPLKNVRGDSHQSNVTVNVNGVENFDAFRRSRSQIAAQFYRGLRMR